MSAPTMKIHVELRLPEGAKRHELSFEEDHLTLYDVLVAMSEKPWGQELFVIQDDRVTQVPGFLMVLEKRMVQQWEADEIQVRNGHHLKFVKVVPGG